MSSKVQTNQISIFKNLFSVEYNGKKEKLNRTDKCKIIAAFVIGLLFAGIGSPIAGLATSYVLRNRRIEQLKLLEQAGNEDLDPTQKATNLMLQQLDAIDDEEVVIEDRTNPNFEAHPFFQEQN